MQFATPLRYPGGKGRLSQFAADVLRRNDLLEGNYAEPYSGGAGIAITLLLQEFVKVIHLNDIDRSVHAFWDTCINNTDVICKRITDTKLNVREWKRQRAIHRDPSSSTEDLGFATFFLNRTNISGVLHGGVIGGIKQRGGWGLDARFNRDNLITKIQRIAAFAGRIRTYNQDAAVFIKKVLPTLPDRTLVYLDPPYYVKGAVLYENHYQHRDHMEIAKLVTSKIRQPWLVSYDDVPEVRRLYNGCRKKTFGINYSAGYSTQGAEVMIIKSGLSVPRQIIPCRGLVL